jgi:GT2 family glycosyltransferase
MTEPDASEPAPTAQGIVVICTRNRPDDLEKALAAVDATAPGLEVLVADSSGPEHAARVTQTVERHPGTSLLTCSPGLARQRNAALTWLSQHRPATPYVYFIDDDTEVLPGYFHAVDATFQARPDVAGVGGVVLNHPRPRHVGAKSVFLLYGRTPGRVLRSGRLTIGHYAGDEAADPQCLPGCAMSYRLDQVRGRRFDERLEGYSFGEDLYFSFELSSEHPLAIAREAQVLHHFSPANRLSRTTLAADKVRLLHRFVREHREQGLRTWAFWWSVFGDTVLKLADGLAHGDRDSVAESMTIARSALGTARHPLPVRPHEARVPGP